MRAAMTPRSPAARAAGGRAHPATPRTCRRPSLPPRHGDYVQVFRLSGASFESADDEQLNTWHERLNVLWRNIASPHVALWSHVIRRREPASVREYGQTGGVRRAPRGEVSAADRGRDAHGQRAVSVARVPPGERRDDEPCRQAAVPSAGERARAAISPMRSTPARSWRRRWRLRSARYEPKRLSVYSLGQRAFSQRARVSGVSHDRRGTAGAAAAGADPARCSPPPDSSSA